MRFAAHLRCGPSAICLWDSRLCPGHYGDLILDWFSPHEYRRMPGAPGPVIPVECERGSITVLADLVIDVFSSDRHVRYIGGDARLRRHKPRPPQVTSHRPCLRIRRPGQAGWLMKYLFVPSDVGNPGGYTDIR